MNSISTEHAKNRHEFFGIPFRNLMGRTVALTNVFDESGTDELSRFQERAIFCSRPSAGKRIETLNGPDGLLRAGISMVSRFDYITEIPGDEGRWPSPPVFIGAFNEARVLTHRFIIAVEGDRLIGETVPRNARRDLIRANDNRDRRLFIRMMPTIQRALSGSCAHRINGVSALLAQANRNYGHWHMDVLPSLALLQEVGIADRVTLITSELHSYRKRTFELMGVDPSRVIEIDNQALDTQYLSCERLLFPSFMMVNYGHVPRWQSNVYSKILKALRSQHGAAQSDFPKRIYVDRGNTSRRRCLNEAELSAKLSNIGFAVIRPEMLSYDEQVLTFANADVVVGCMGAALVNVAFARRGAKVIELKPPLHRKTKLWKTYSTMAGASHTAIDFGDEAISEGDTWRIPDVEATVSAIQKLC